MSRLASPTQQTAAQGAPGAREKVLQRKCACGKSSESEEQCDDCKKQSMLHRSAAGAPASAAAPRIVHDVLRAPGRPLDTKTRSFMDARFSHNFADVRVHTDARAAESARSVGALAYTVGSDVVFEAGQYAPESPSGQRLLAHELAHVVQQRGSAAGVQTKLIIGPAGDSFEREAENAAERVTASSAAASVSNTAERRVQRASAADIAEPAAATPSAASAQGGAGALIVEDDSTDPGPGQMKKSEFIERLRTAACAAADAELAALGRSTKGCPYIERWLGRYQSAPSARLERAVRKYAPESSGVKNAAEYIPLVVARIRRGVNRWATTGDLSDVPEEFQGEMAGGGIVGAIGGVLGDIGGAISGAVSGIGRAVGGLFTKAREDGPRNTSDPAAIQSQLHSGAALDTGVRARMESALGQDFSDVRVHTYGRAAQLSSSLNARAFTVGSDVAFAAGQYRPGTPFGDALIAHELAHVSQQRGGAVAERREALEEDADTSAAAAVASIWAGQTVSAAPRLRSRLSLQRCGSSCPQDWQDKLKWAVARAHSWVDTAAKALDAALSTPNKIESETAKQLRHKFKLQISGEGSIDASSMAALKEIRSAFGKVQSGFANPPFKCDPTGSPSADEGGDVSGWGFEFLTRAVSSISLSRSWFETKRPDVAVMTIIHEMFHKYAGKTDEARGMLIYFCAPGRDSGAKSFQDVRAKLSIDDILGLADMYAILAFYLNNPGGDYCNTAAPVVPNPNAAGAPASPPAGAVQRKCACGNSAGDDGECDDCKKKDALQRRAAAGAGPALAPPAVHETIRSRGEPLDPNTRSLLEPRFGHDFGGVRVHTGPRAAESARSIQALAYTAGSHVVFGEGQYAPDTPAGRRLIAHELAHVVQQRGTRVPGGPRALTVGPADDPLERDAERAADGAVHGPAPASHDGRVQRATEDSVAGPKPAGGLIADEEVRDLAPGHMRKSDFLTALRSAACVAADAELAALGRSTAGCPYVERWINRYYSRPASHVERAVHKYAPESVTATTASAYIPLVVERIRQGVKRWAATGEITGVPEELASEIPGGGLIGAIGGALGAVGGAIADAASAVASGAGAIASGIGGLFASPRQGGARVHHGAGVQSKLGEGAPLDSGVRSRMESAFGHDFSRVRVHADDGAARLSEGVNARAFAVGSDVAFAHGEYRPGSAFGEALIAHELAHVVQQEGPVTRPRPVSGGSSEYGNLERDADFSAAGVMAALWGGKRAGRGAMPRLRSGLRLQRCGGGGGSQLGPSVPKVTGEDIEAKLTATKSVIAPIVKHRFQEGHRIAGHVHQLPDDEYTAKFIEYAMTVGHKSRAEAKDDVVPAFNWNGEIYFKEGVDLGTVIHESIHTLFEAGPKTFGLIGGFEKRAKPGDPLIAKPGSLRAYEGGTEHFTRIICAEFKIPRDPNIYKEELELFNELAVVGEEILADAYFNGNVKTLIDTYNSKMSNPNAFKEWQSRAALLAEQRSLQ